MKFNILNKKHAFEDINKIEMRNNKHTQFNGSLWARFDRIDKREIK